MSIYATLESFLVPKLTLHDSEPENFVRVWIQGVPAHIDYTGPEWAFLPPPVSEEECPYRFIVVCGPESVKGTARNHQEYQKPLFTMTGPEYTRITWTEMWRRIENALEPVITEARRAKNAKEGFATREQLEARRAKMLAEQRSA
jgi:hypothetical protein